MRRTLLIAILLLATGCNVEPQHNGSGGHWHRVGDYDDLLKTCDGHRLVYLYQGYRSGGIAAVDNAPECADGTLHP